MEEKLNIEDLTILLQAVEDWVLAEQNIGVMELLNLASYMQTPEDVEKLKDRIKGQKIKAQEEFQKQKEKGILLQGKLIKMKKCLLNGAIPKDFMGGINV